MAKRHFSEQFKQESVVLALGQSGQSTQAIAQQLGLGVSTLERWIRERRGQPGSSRKPHSAEQQRIKQLEKEVAHLREVNEILKKVHVYFVNNPNR